MKRIRKIFRRDRTRPLRDDLFAEKIRQSLGGFADDVSRFSESIKDFALEEATRDLLLRIEALEKAVAAMRNGTGEYPKIRL